MRERESGSSDERKGVGESLKAWLNYCSAYSALFMWREGLVQLPGVGGL